ncbi:YdcF family protein [Erythrobacter sp. EC-HK427]|uniref:YdcF family protein n=1 Tax=Erythrobacter sp. EC-HK427 TaxID=2038396 RepID=UPI0012552F96|nr:YdcF family protein [Erythrobacter sp. EC-HK427]VVT14594.1 conserved hypothetical protein [Erythrobacter sp. EC-HK427]
MTRRRLAIPLLALGWLGAIAVWIASGPKEAPQAQAAAAIVLGAAVARDTPTPVFQARIDHAVDLHREGRVQYLIFTGARSEDDTLAESEAARIAAIAAGVPEDAILIETQSLTTMQNLVEAQSVMRDAGISSAIIVSDPLHLRRAMAMADALGIDAQPSATPATRYRSWRTKAPFLMREVYFLHHFWLFGE